VPTVAVPVAFVVTTFFVTTVVGERWAICA
jgi:hypothetical protein